jgi:hypothetical protein
MKARIFIVRAFVLAMVLAPSTLWASARHLGVSSCRVEKAHYRASHTSRQRGRTLGQLVAAMPRHHAPAPRLHRIRGKKINVQSGLVFMARSYAPTRFDISDAQVGQQDLDGPNPSRGPPSQFSL